MAWFTSHPNVAARVTRHFVATWSFGGGGGGGKVGKPGTTTVVSGGAIEIPGKSTVEALFDVADMEGLLKETLIGLYITHSSVGDLELRLVHPDGTAILLFQNRGGNGDDIGAKNNLAVFDDTAVASIATGAAPFTGPWKPEVPLAGLKDKAPNGTWRLRVTNEQNQGGILQGATLLVGTTSSSSVGGGGGSFVRRRFGVVIR